MSTHDEPAFVLDEASWGEEEARWDDQPDWEQAVADFIPDDADPDADPVEASRQELDEVAAGFRQRMGAEADRAELATMSDFYTCVTFATRQQLWAFLDATGWRKHSLWAAGRFIDGRALAKTMNIELPPDPQWRQPHRDAAWDDRAMTVQDNRAITTEKE
ncbi:MAG: hypothetical protein ACT4NY_09140 [Pseudonocardiales bacterium]